MCSERLLELRGMYQTDPGVNDMNALLVKFTSEYPSRGQAILSKIKEEDWKKWFAGEGKDVAIDKVLKACLSSLEDYKAVFEEKLVKLETDSIKNDVRKKLQLIEQLLTFQETLLRFNAIHFEKVENAIVDIQARFPEEYNGNTYLELLNELKIKHQGVQQELGNHTPLANNLLLEFVKEYESWKKEVLLSNPLINKTPIVFVTRKQYAKDHHNTATLFHTNEINTNMYAPGGAMKVIDISDNGKVTTLLETTEGVIRDPELSYDAKKIIFSMRKNIEEDYHIYEIDVDGSNLKQLTSAEGVADIDPKYLPDGGIVFSSTRNPKYCMCNIHIMANLFRMELDGANVTQLGKSSLFEGHSTILPDGRILYDRWEYVDRNFGDAQALWTMNPDGTNQAIYFGNNTNSPGGFIDARAIPGTDKVLSILGSCHDRPWGALGIINREKGVDGKESVERTWPASARDLIGKGNWDTFLQVRPLYEDPFPINDTYFLCSRSIGVAEQMGLYLIDTFGNEQLIYIETPGCYDPIPIQKHGKELVIESKRNYKSQSGKFYVQNVYEGTHMKGVEHDAVKYLRVVESMEKRSWTEPAWNGQGVHRPAMNWHSFECKKILGTVPVEDDGSVYVEVPADKYVYFQLLDENKMMIQSMRSGTMVHSGETLGCVGCHDDRRTAPSTMNSKFPKALQLPPRKLNGWYGKARNFGFMKEVQPVFDKHCVSCHDFGKKAGKELILASDRNPYFNAAYMEMWMKKIIAPVGAGPAEIREAYSWGAHPSKLIKLLKGGHADVKLSKEEMERLTTWIDLNAVYYSDFISAYPNNTVGRSPLSEKELDRLGKLTNINFRALNGHGRKLGPQISFDRPDKSPCLNNIKNKNSSDYKEALALIIKGKEQLSNKPRLDMDGFVPSATDQKRLMKYKYRLEEEMKSREAIMEGKKHYDKQINLTE